MKTKLEHYFEFTQYQTSWRQEGLAGLTTFLTMAYIIFVNPDILGSAGMDRGAVFIATCIVAACGSLLMGWLSRYPIAIAPAMALNVYFTYVMVQGFGLTWQEGLGAVLIAAVIFFIIAVTRIRIWLVQAIPESLNLAITVGLGLFIALIALKNAGIVVTGKGGLLTFGSLELGTLFFGIGFILIAILDYYKIPGAILIGILFTTILGLCFGLTTFSGIVSIPPSLQPTFLHLDFSHLGNWQGISIILSLVFVSVFDCTGTLVGLLTHAKLTAEQNTVRRIARGLLADSLTSILAPLVGSSGPSPYLESASGIRAGGKTGVTCFVVGILFVIAIFFSPLAKTIPAFATAPALLFLACLMIRNVADIPWSDLTESIPCGLTALMIPYTLSVADGIGFGMISYTLLKLCTKQTSKLNLMLIILSILFLIYFVLQAFMR